MALVGDARGEHARGETAWLQDDDFAVAEEAVVEEDLRDLGRFAGAGRRLEDETRLVGERPNDRDSRS